MFDIDKWQEIFHTINKNRLRTALTAFSVSWGIFMLMLLLGAGTGLQNGVKYQFEDDATNTIFVRPRQTSMPYKGLQPGRNIQFENEDYDIIKRKVEGLDNISGRFYVRGESTIRYKDKYNNYSVRGVHPDHKNIEKSIITSGRYINELDLRERRKVAIVGKKVAEAIFQKDFDPIGEYITIGDFKYKVVGVFDDLGSERETEQIVIPITLAQVAYGGMDRIDHISVTTGDASMERSKEMEAQILSILSDRHIFDPEDTRAVSIFNLGEEFKKFMDLFFGIKLFLWVVGIGTIIAGIVGVSNIMLITVKERTREIGIRKAMGANPRAIIGLFLQESIFITVLSGYAGLVLGIGLIELINFGITSSGAEMPFFRNPEIDLTTAVSSTLLLIISGTLAGYFPAKKASKIEPIEALRDE